MRPTAALRSDVRNLVRALDVPRSPTEPSACAAPTYACRYAGNLGRHGRPLCTMRNQMDGRPCPLYRKEDE